MRPRPDRPRRRLPQRRRPRPALTRTDTRQSAARGTPIEPGAPYIRECMRAGVFEMAVRPRDVASRMVRRRQPADGFLRQTFILPRDQARAKARDFLARYPKGGYMSAVESWRELP